MTKKIILNAFGPDKPGIVYNITKTITTYNGNIELSKMLQMESDFSLLMLIKIPHDKINNLFKDLDNIEELEINYKITTTNKQTSNYTNFSFSISVADNEGIIYKFSDLFKKNKINIVNMDTFVKNAPNTGFPIFKLESILMIPNKLDLDKFKIDLKEIAEKNSIDFIFDKI